MASVAALVRLWAASVRVSAVPVWAWARPLAAAHNSALTPAGVWLRHETPNARAISRPTCTTSARAVPRPMPPVRCGIRLSWRVRVLSIATDFNLTA
jgi:hypothetical protein